MNKILTLTLSLCFTACAASKAQFKAAGPIESLSIKSYTSGEPGFYASSHLIMGKTEAILIDSQFTRKDARKLVTMIRETDRKLRYVFITHAHPDHYFGLEIIKEQFPTTKIIAPTNVVKEIIATGSAKKEYWKKIYKDDLTDDVIYPQPFDEPFISLGNNEIRILKTNGGESKSAAAVYIPALRALATGDLTYNNVHLWLADTDGGSPKKWIETLKKFKQREDVDTVLPGHGKAAGPVLFEANQKYIEKFLESIEESETPEMAIGDMRAAFAEYQMAVILDLSVRARFKKEVKSKESDPTAPMTYK